LSIVDVGWVQTPADIRKLGGALFGDRRFGHVFVRDDNPGEPEFA
jgi:hypothetical protein